MLRSCPVLALLLVACGESVVPALDGGPDAGPSNEAALPVLTPCAAGWREVALDGATHCEPWPASGRVDACAEDEAHFPGTEGCARVGAPCGDDGWPIDLPTDRQVLYVSAAVARGGIGTREDPLASINDGLVLADPGAVIALAEGEYEDDQIYVPAGVTIWGACTMRTRITTDVAEDESGVVFLAEPGAELRNVRISMPERPGIVAGAEGVRVRDVIVEGARVYALGIAEGSVEATGFVVRAMRAGASVPYGRAMVVLGGTAIVRGGRFDSARQIAVITLGAGARTELHGVAISRTAPLADGIGAAVTGQNGPHILLEDVVLEDSGEHAIAVDSEGTVLEGSGVVIRGTTSAGDAAAIFPTGGAVVRLSRSRIDGVQGMGVAPQGAPVELTDVVIRDLATDPDGTGGRGVDVVLGGSARLERVLIARAAEAGLAAVDVGSTIDARDVSVIEIAGGLGGRFGRGIVAQGAGSVTALRVRISGARDLGVIATGEGSRISGTHVVVEDMRGAGDGEMGIGVWAERDGAITLRDARVRRARMAGAGAIAGGTLTLEGVTIEDTLEATCAPACSIAGGFGIASPYDGRVTVSDFVIERSALCGVVVGQSADHEASVVDLMRGVIRSAPVGACVQAEGYDVARLNREVRYEDVGVPLQSTTYPLPDALEEP